MAVSDPLGAWTDHVTSDTEQIGVFRSLADGRLIAPDLDPRVTDSGGYAERALDGTWTDRSTRISDSGTVVTHVFDFIEHAGSLWACGSGGPGARVWRSTDGGATWVLSLEGPAGDFNRFYCFVAEGAVLRVKDPETGQAFRWTAGGGWVGDGAGILPAGVTGGPGLAWGSRFVVQAQVPLGRAPQQLYCDGAPFGPANAVGFDVGDDGALYILNVASIHRFVGNSETNSYPAGAGGGDNSALAILPGCTQAVVGTSDSRLKLVDLV